MRANKYLCLYRGAPSGDKPSPQHMEEMFAAFHAWMEKYKDNFVDIGSKLKSTGRVVTPSGATDGPFAESKELIGGFMILGADNYDEAVAVVTAMPGMQAPGACVEIREMAQR
jgi:hypothetical protein